VAEQRASKPSKQTPFFEPDEETQARLEASNGLRQLNRLVEMIDAGIQGRFRLRPSQLIELNRFAVDGLIEQLPRCARDPRAHTDRGTHPDREHDARAT